MRVCIIMNDPLAPPGAIEDWIRFNNHKMTLIKAYENEVFPLVDEFDLLIILGGSVGAYQAEEHLWLKSEKSFIYKAIKADKYVFGICLGAQLIAEVLGGRVYPMESEEIGWATVHLSNQEKTNEIFNRLPNEFTVFQYHGDTFTLPKTAQIVGEGTACKDQLFRYENKVLGLQFHPEFNENIIKDIIKNFNRTLQHKFPCKNNEELYSTLVKRELISAANNILFELLDGLTAR